MKRPTFDRNLPIDRIADLADRSRAVLRLAGVTGLGEAADDRGGWRGLACATRAVIDNVEDVLADHGLLA